MRNERYINSQISPDLRGDRKMGKNRKKGIEAIEQQIRSDPAYQIEKAKAFEKARETKSVKPILELMKKLLDHNAKITAQLIAKDYLKYLQKLNIEKRSFSKKTIKRFTYAIYKVRELLEKYDLNECSKYLKAEWDRWISNDLWEKVGYNRKTDQQNNTDQTNLTEIEILRKISGVE